MAKGSGKSSASSGTRKKHARRANAGPDDPVTSVSKPKDKKQKGKGKQAIEPRKKAYIPPTKPAPVRADPLDSLGLVHQLPAELVVILRKLGKKDEVTKTKALEEFQNEWVEGVKGIEAESMEEGLGLMLPVWLHHVPILFSHSSRRIRLLAVTIHGKLFRIVHVRGQLFFNLREVLDADSVELILGSWCMAAHDIDRQVSITARRSLDEHVSLFQSDTKLAVSHAALVSFVQRAIFDPLGYYLYLNPVQVPINTTPPKIVRGRVVATPPSASRPVEPEVRHVDEENEDDRKARLRVGALGVLQWLLDSRAQTDDESKTIADLMELLSHPSLWTSLQSWSKDSNAYGLGQPPVRSSAWKLLHTLVLNWKADILPLIPMLSAAVLYAAPREPDVQVRSVSLAPWLTFLKEFPNAWELEATYSDVDSEEEGESEAEEEARVDDQSPKAGDASKITPIKRWGAFREFLQFLELGCGGSPIQCYPIVLIILSTIPPSILTQADTDRAVPYPAHAFFVSFWAALDGRALSSTLERSATSLAFLSSLLECTAFIARRLRSETQGPAMLANHEDQDGNGASRALVRDQYARAWEEMVQGRLKLDHAQGAKMVAGSLTALESYSPELFEGAWNAFMPSLMEHAINGSPLAFVFARTFRETFSQETHAHVVAGKLVGDIASSIIMTARTLLMQDSDAGATGAAQLAGLASLIETFNDTLSKDAQLSQDLHSTMQGGLYKLAGIAPKLLVVYIARCVDQTLWQNLLAAISARPTLVHSALPVLVEAAENDALPDPLRPVDQALDSALATLFQEAADHRNNEALRLVLRVVRHHEHFLSASSFETLLHLVVAQLGEQCCVLLSAGEKDIPRFEALLDIVAAAVCTPSGFVAPVDIAEALIPDVFLAAHLFGICYEGGEIAGVVRLAKRIWREWMGVADKLGAENITMIIHRKLRDTICDVTAKAAPRDVLRAATTAQLPLRVDITTILPEPAFLNQLAAKLNQHPAHPALAVILPLIPPTSSFDIAETVELQTDVAGLSAYARATSAWLQAAMDDRYMARSQIWILRHLINLGVLAEEFMIAPGLQSPLFSKEVEKGMLEGIMLKVQQLAAYLLSVPHHDKWHADVTSAVTNGKTSGLDPTATCVAELLSGAVDRNTYRESRIVFDVLLYVLSDASTMEADLWMGLARKLEKAAEQISLAIVHALARSGAEPLRLDRYRNELAADALGVPTSQVNTKGLLLLRRLAASAPDPDSDVAFLPQQRAINLVKACNTWLASDEDIEEDVESELTGLFVHLVPILQNVPGSHWELMLDIVENNLEASCSNASFDDELTLTSLIRSIRLAETIQEFATYNKALREIWSTRKGPLLSLIMNIVASEKSATVYFEPRSICREAALLLLQNMPASLLDHETLSKTTHLLSDPSTTVLKMSYELLRDAAKKYTEHLVIEAGVDLESQVKIELPTELVSFLQEHTIDIADPASEKGSSIFALLLGWMVFLDLFEDTSAKVKTGYAEQLTFLDITATHLLPTISTLLDIRPNSKPFKLDVWAVDEFYIPEADPDDFLSMRLFAAHVYYRALITIPSLVRDWLTSYNDRGTQITIAGYTSTFFSPPIISSELTRIRTAEGSDLEADNFAVKLAPTVREISAVYTVDDQQLEFTLKIPSNWPLQRIEIRESKLVGVTESRWRGWLLGVQQIVWSQNGHVLDAIKHFKNNVVLHFQGQVECAICYSIISASEGALPKKPCRTCKNRFHSSCLYKWFESSHSSSCPLCRSDIM